MTGETKHVNYLLHLIVLHLKRVEHEFEKLLGVVLCKSELLDDFKLVGQLIGHCPHFPVDALVDIKLDVLQVVLLTDDLKHIEGFSELELGRPRKLVKVPF